MPEEVPAEPEQEPVPEQDQGQDQPDRPAADLPPQQNTQKVPSAGKSRGRPLKREDR
jgi:hypothetical protein